jgi:hypothetical protein
VRRLRAKLGPENEAMIGTVRNVGYRFVPVKGALARPESAGAGRAGLDNAGLDSAGNEGASDDSAGADSAANGAIDPEGVSQSDPGAARTARPESAHPERATAHVSR